MGCEIYHLNKTIFNLNSRLGTSSTLDGEKLITAQGTIKLVHNKIQDINQSLTTEENIVGKRYDQANKREEDT